MVHGLCGAKRFSKDRRPRLVVLRMHGPCCTQRESSEAQIIFAQEPRRCLGVSQNVHSGLYTLLQVSLNELAMSQFAMIDGIEDILFRIGRWSKASENNREDSGPGVSIYAWYSNSRFHVNALASCGQSGVTLGSTCMDFACAVLELSRGVRGMRGRGRTI